MSKKLLLAYVLFFISINTMAAFASIECKTSFEGVSNQTEESQLLCNKAGHGINAVLEIDEAPDNNLTGLYIKENEPSNSGSLIFVLIIPALLVFLFSRFEKSSK